MPYFPPSGAAAPALAGTIWVNLQNYGAVPDAKKTQVTDLSCASGQATVTSATLAGQLGAGTASAGKVIRIWDDTTQADVAAQGHTVVSVSGNVVTLSANVQSAVSAGDTALFAWGSTGFAAAFIAAKAAATAIAANGADAALYCPLGGYMQDGASQDQYDANFSNQYGSRVVGGMPLIGAGKGVTTLYAVWSNGNLLYARGEAQPVIVAGLTTDGLGDPNGDGIKLMQCQRFLVRDCDFVKSYGGFHAICCQDSLVADCDARQTGFFGFSVGDVNNLGTAAGGGSPTSNVALERCLAYDPRQLGFQFVGSPISRPTGIKALGCAARLGVTPGLGTQAFQQYNAEVTYDAEAIGGAGPHFWLQTGATMLGRVVSRQSGSQGVQWQGASDSAIDAFIRDAGTGHAASNYAGLEYQDDNQGAISAPSADLALSAVNVSPATPLAAGVYTCGISFVNASGETTVRTFAATVTIAAGQAVQVAAPASVPSNSGVWYWLSRAAGNATLGRSYESSGQVAVKLTQYGDTSNAPAANTTTNAGSSRNVARLNSGNTAGTSPQGYGAHNTGTSLSAGNIISGVFPGNSQAAAQVGPTDLLYFSNQASSGGSHPAEQHGGTPPNTSSIPWLSFGDGTFNGSGSAPDYVGMAGTVWGHNFTNNFWNLFDYQVAGVRKALLGAYGAGGAAGSLTGPQLFLGGGIALLAGQIGGNGVDAALSLAAGSVAVPASGTVTLTAAQYATPYLTLTGAATGAVNVVVPSAGLWVVFQNTTGAQTITVKTAGGSGIAIAAGKRAILIADGTNVVRLTPDT